MSDAVERLRACISASMITRVQKTSATQLRDDIQEVLTQLAADKKAVIEEAQRDFALADLRKSERDFAIEEMQKALDAISAQLAEATSDVEATNLEWEKRYVQRGRELTALRAQLERSPCGHLVADMDERQVMYTDGSPSRELEQVCAGCLREADAVRRTLEMVTNHRFITQEDASDPICSCGYQLPSDAEDDCVAYYDHILSLWPTPDEAGETPAPTAVSSVQSASNSAPASQPTAEPLLNISDSNNEWNKRAITANRGKHGKEG